MSVLLRRCMLAALSCASAPGVHAAKAEPPTMDTVHAAPLHMVVLHERTRLRLPYFAPPGVIVTSDTIPAGTLIAGNLLGGLLVAGIERQRLKEAQASVQPAYDILRDGGCLLERGSTFMDAVQPIAMDDAAPPVTRHVLTGEARLEDIFPAGSERHVVLITYSLTPDMDYLLTTAHAMYVPAGKKGKDARVSWSRTLTVAAPALPLPAKTPAEIERLVSEENRRWQSSGNAALVQAANKGDMTARRQVAGANRQYEEALKQARSPAWSLPHASVEHARTWSADGCAGLQQAHADNAMQLGALMPRLYADDLPPSPKPGLLKATPMPEVVAGDMTISPAGDAAWLSWPVGAHRPGGQLSSAWMPEAETDSN